MIKSYFYRKYKHYVVECGKKKRDEETKLTLTHDQEPKLMVDEETLMLNEEKVMAN